MKNINKKGFTLIELLAVIVVLAIVTVIATRSVLPFMANAGRDAFASEANIAKDSAANAMALISIGSIDEENYTKEAGGKYCFTLANLKTLGLFEKDDDTYVGTVTVTPSGNSYTYAVSMKNEKYYVNTTSGNIKAEALNEAKNNNGVGEVADDVTIKTGCEPVTNVGA